MGELHQPFSRDFRPLRQYRVWRCHLSDPCIEPLAPAADANRYRVIRGVGANLFDNAALAFSVDHRHVPFLLATPSPIQMP